MRIRTRARMQINPAFAKCCAAEGEDDIQQAKNVTAAAICRFRFDDAQ